MLKFNLNLYTSAKIGHTISRHDVDSNGSWAHSRTVGVEVDTGDWEQDSEGEDRRERTRSPELFSPIKSQR